MTAKIAPTCTIAVNAVTPGVVDRRPSHCLDDGQVAGARDGQELGDSFDDAEDDRLQPGHAATTGPAFLTGSVARVRPACIASRDGGQVCDVHRDDGDQEDQAVVTSCRGRGRRRRAAGTASRRGRRRAGGSGCRRARTPSTALTPEAPGGDGDGGDQRGEEQRRSASSRAELLGDQVAGGGAEREGEQDRQPVERLAAAW